jgi:hypothetical protein
MQNMQRATRQIFYFVHTHVSRARVHTQTMSPTARTHEQQRTFGPFLQSASRREGERTNYCAGSNPQSRCVWWMCVEIRHSQERGIVVRKKKNEERGLKEKNSEGKCVCVRACLCLYVYICS